LYYNIKGGVGMSKFNIDVGQKIFNARKSLNMSRAELGKKVGLHESTVKRYEDGHINSLDIAKLKEFASALNISPAYLMGWEIDEQCLDSLTDKEEFQLLIGEFYAKGDEFKKCILKSLLKLKDKESWELVAKIIEKLAQAEENSSE
jgi:transcriptional regulator with XRE-family HTH domain